MSLSADHRQTHLVDDLRQGLGCLRLLMGLPKCSDSHGDHLDFRIITHGLRVPRAETLEDIPLGSRERHGRDY